MKTAVKRILLREMSHLLDRDAAVKEEDSFPLFECTYPFIVITRRPRSVFCCQARGSPQSNASFLEFVHIILGKTFCLLASCWIQYTVIWEAEFL